MADTQQEATPAVVVPTEAPVAPAVEGVVVAAEGAAKAVDAKVDSFATEARIELTAEEKFFVTKLENDYLKAAMEIQRLTKTVESAQKQFPMFVEGLVKKYEINPATHVFNNIELVFTKKA